MSYPDNLDKNRPYIPNNYLEVQEDNEIRTFEEEMSSSSVTITPSSFRCDHSSEIYNLKKIVIGLTLCFLIFTIYFQYSYGVLRVENERLLKEINENKYIF